VDVLTPEEKEKVINLALSKARSLKIAEIEKQAYWKKVIAGRPKLNISSEDYLLWVLRRADDAIEDFILTEEEKYIYETLSFYFTKNEEFNNRGTDFDLKKGLLIYGNIGAGKTTLLECFAHNPRVSFMMANCQSVSNEFKKGGIAEVEKYYGLLKSISPTKFMQTEITIAFDDFGLEIENGSSKNFGNEVNVMADILYERYEKRIVTHMTTNLNPQTIEDYYGKRIRSRMLEMFNLISFPVNSIDKRK
jgi:DNA replication protein DnaC